MSYNLLKEHNKMQSRVGTLKLEMDDSKQMRRELLTSTAENNFLHAQVEKYKAEEKRQNKEIVEVDGFKGGEPVNLDAIELESVEANKVSERTGPGTQTF
ncbi:hypothetical protein HHI36_002511 [Cryptolaemus montrouzieri]|uniref:Uncharacterized protein n=1 Tax=Cryptolaemus montrouzieri TaxID=559131 RepID=A0ABD2PB12_9CUCU